MLRRLELGRTGLKGWFLCLSSSLLYYLKKMVQKSYGLNQFMQRSRDRETKHANFSSFTTNLQKILLSEIPLSRFLYLMGQNYVISWLLDTREFGEWVVFSRDHYCHKQDWGLLDRSKKQLRRSSQLFHF